MKEERVDLLDALKAWEDALVQDAEAEALGSWRDDARVARLRQQVQLRRFSREASPLDEVRLEHLDTEYDKLLRLLMAVEDALARGDPRSVLRGWCDIADFSDPGWWDESGSNLENRSAGVIM